jgi:hypothetical protein
LVIVQARVILVNTGFDRNSAAVSSIFTRKSTPLATPCQHQHGP